ncbi:MAG: DNA recombination protein RmuC [Syntrophomonas sp.]|uniref:DNA recombination protein RmuC n=1 Tax=Syntrophomonas sp. TaxID=2053627 RepID=UPI00263652BD|nr:DNA recombination protein RmuC [Syntrophomonas sp.]MDD2509982.1 DNA recombination protein RmuC [Syntrophomonas sp.]MDD3878657.1 DNA recombination protein RmuC [Syntrophomonas sp.]MDD4626141.1 DNA recombination protein RmuC [Syntrophomonas sp.]
MMEQAAIMAVFIGIVLLFFLLFQLQQRMNTLRDQLDKLAAGNLHLEKNQERMEQLLREEIGRNREEMSLTARQGREELSNSFKTLSDSLSARMAEMGNLQQYQLEGFSQQMAHLTQSNEQKLEQMRGTIEERVRELQKENAQKLDQMRNVVDEKLHATLEQRLGESFKLVSERLEQVHKGLGEMQALATGVGDLKKVLTNVKTRGTWGEVQLGNILEDILAPEQYGTNVAVKKGAERVEFAIKLPGPDKENSPLWLPIDAKFPMEDYYRLLEAYDGADLTAIEQAGKNLENRIKAQAKEICGKYIEPPATTDFAIMFLPTEGLYAEVLRRPGLFENLRQDYRVTVAGPTTLAAILNSLSMGFRTLAIQKRSGEVWAILGAVKSEFGKFGTVLEKTRKKLQEASNSIEEAARRSRVMERKLKDVEELPEKQAGELLSAEGFGEEIAAGSDG